MVELESEGEMTRNEVAAFLREFADELELDGDDAFERTQVSDPDEHREGEVDERPHEHKRITFIVGGDSATVTLPETVDFDVEIESRSPMLRSGVNQGIELDLSWQLEDTDEELDDDRIEIE